MASKRKPTRKVTLKKPLKITGTVLKSTGTVLKGTAKAGKPSKRKGRKRS